MENKTKTETVNCVLCHSFNYQLIDNFLFNGNGLGLVRCLNCGLGYTNPRITKEALNEYFQSYRRVSKAEIDFWRRNKFPVIKQIIKFIKKYEPGKILDIGCAYGFLLNDIRELGWVPYGVEISRPNVDYARKSCGLNVFNGYLHGAAFQDKSFKIVAIMDTLYYSYDPIQELKEVKRILEDEGLVIIREVNRIDYIYIWQTIKRLLGFKQPLSKNIFFSGMFDHLYFFNTRSLRKVLDVGGFKDIRFFNAVMAYEIKCGIFINIIRKLLRFIFDIIWWLSGKKICLAPSIIAIAKK